MKKIIYIFLSLIIILTSSTISAKAAMYLDVINNYEITVNPRKDGTLDMQFNIKWTVLDSKTEGPLEWIKIGIPNRYVDEIVGISSNIKKIKYYSESGSYIRIDLDRKYKTGETLDISFSIHQSRMYFLDGDGCYYDYNPGWFEDMYVENMLVKWNKEGVVDTNLIELDGDYYCISDSNLFEETLKVKMRYDQSYFEGLDSDMQFTDAYMSKGDIIGIIAIITFIILMIVVIIIISRKTNPYYYERGFVGYHYHYRRRYYRSGYYSSGKRISVPQVTNSTGFRGGSGGCACACACACAGGGRAGCSMKDFYKHPNLEKIKENLSK